MTEYGIGSRTLVVNCTIGHVTLSLLFALGGPQFLYRNTAWSTGCLSSFVVSGGHPD